MSKPWRWSKDGAVAELLPTGDKSWVRIEDVRAFVEASDEVQFEVLRVLRRQAQPFTDGVFAMGGLFVAFYALVLSGFVSEDGLISAVLLAVVTFGLIGVVFTAVRLRRAQAIAEEWRAAFEHALQQPRGKPARRRWFGVS